MSLGQGPGEFDPGTFNEQEQKLEQAAERHREETDGEPSRKGRGGRLIDRIRVAMRRHDSNSESP